MNRLQKIVTELNKSNVTINLHAHFDHARLYDRIGVLLVCLDNSGGSDTFSDLFENARSPDINSHGTNVAAKVKLPEIKLAAFPNKKEESFRNCIRSFEAVIDKHRLLDYEKFVFLKTHLAGGPLA